MSLFKKKNRVKVSVDATIFDSSNCYSFAVVGCSHRGKFIEALSNYKAGNVTHKVVESIGIWETLSWVKSQQHSNFEVETDRH